MASSYENNLSCAVCLELYHDPRFLPCGHSYCLKCLLDVQNKSSTKSIIKCPICQAESSSENGGPASFPKNYDLNSLVQLFILETRGQDTTGQTYFCEICDLQKSAERFCSDCETMYCETCFNTCHPMSGKLGKHKIVNIDENFKLKEDTKADDRNMYCSDCDDLISAADVSGHKKHDIVTLSEAHSIFKVKLDEATGNIDLMQSTLESDLDRSKEKKVLLESMFEEIEMELARKKEDVLMIHNVEVKEAQAGIDNLLPAMSAYRELQGREDTMSFILECQNILRGSPLKDEFSDVHEMFDRINSMTLSNQAILAEIQTLEDGVAPDQEGNQQYDPEVVLMPDASVEKDVEELLGKEIGGLPQKATRAQKKKKKRQTSSDNSNPTEITNLEVAVVPDSPETDPLLNKIYITGLMPDIVENSLRQHFSSVGSIEVDKFTGNPKIWINRDKIFRIPKGDAMVTYDDAETASAAVHRFNNKEFNGSVIKVEHAKSKARRGSGGFDRGGQGGGDGGSESGGDRQAYWKCSNPSCGNSNLVWRNNCNLCNTAKSGSDESIGESGFRGRGFAHGRFRGRGGDRCGGGRFRGRWGNRGGRGGDRGGGRGDRG